MWEMKDSNKDPREFSARYSNNKRCGLCKTFFRPNEKFYIIVIPSALRGSHARLKENMFVHVDEWEEICTGVTTDEELAAKIIAAKFPKRNELTQDESDHLEAFKEACTAHGFRMEVSKPYGVRMKKRGTSMYLDYNVYMDTISFDHRGQHGLFDSFYERQIIANIYNKMHELLSDGKHDDYDYKDSINKVAAEVGKTMNEIF